MPRLELQTNRRQSFHIHGECAYDYDKQMLTHMLQANVKLGLVVWLEQILNALVIIVPASQYHVCLPCFRV